MKNDTLARCLEKMDEQEELINGVLPLVCNLEFPGSIEIHLNNGGITIERCQSQYRGNFMVKVNSNNLTKFYIDSSDMFPRYYFKASNLVEELLIFLQTRGNQEITNIIQLHHE